MSHVRPETTSSLLVRSGLALGLGQRALGELLGVSRSTIHRWSARNHGDFPPRMLKTLVHALHPIDPDLAAAVASHHHETPASLGVTVAPPVPVVAPPPPHPLLIDTVVCAAAELAGATPAAMRPVVLAAFERAQAVGFSIEVVIAGLRAGVASAERQRG